MGFEKYIFQPRTIVEMIKDPDVKVVIDTNVLLAAYQWRNFTVKEIIEVLRNLVGQKRLIIPAHVVKEFARNRPELIAKMIQGIDQEISSKFNKPRDLVEVVPALGDTVEYTEAEQSREQYLNSSKVYRNALESLRDKLVSLFDSDPVLAQYAEIFEESYYEPQNLLDMEVLEKEAEKRFKNKIPPGYKDAGKTENSAGDYIVWRHILELRSDVVFVTLDKKTDWALTSSDKVITARHELVLEFYEETDGKSFQLVSPKEFFSLIDPNMSEEAKEDLDTNVVELSGESTASSELNSMAVIAGALANGRSRTLVKRFLDQIRNNPAWYEERLTSDQPASVQHCEMCGRADYYLINGLCSRCNAIEAED